MWAEQEYPGSCKHGKEPVRALWLEDEWPEHCLPEAKLLKGEGPLRGSQPISCDGWPCTLCCRSNSLGLPTVILQDDSSLTREKQPARARTTFNYCWGQESLFSFFSLPNFLLFSISSSRLIPRKWNRRKLRVSEYLWCTRLNNVG